jgi:hypothetical protein
MPIVSSAKFFIVSGVCLGFFFSNKRDDRKQMLLYGAMLFALPIVTIGAFGFAQLGISLLTTGIAFFAYRRKPGDSLLFVKALPIVLCIFYFGASAYVTYLEQRTMIRSVIWRGAGISDRLNVVVKAASNFEFFDWTQPRHLHLIDMRLNQSSLTGKAITKHRRSNMKFENGKTLIYATVAWIPRIIWWNKPVEGGSDFVARHTGQEFARGTTVAAGQFFELYVNFGYLGIIVGFTILGILIRWLDVRCCEHLASNELSVFVRYHVIGMVSIQSSSFVFSMVSAVAGAYLVTVWLGRWLARSQQKFV